MFGILDITMPVTPGSSLPFSLGNTIGRGGIASLETADGTPIEDFSAQGDSGFDYRQAYASAVPEPAPGALFALRRR